MHFKAANLAAFVLVFTLMLSNDKIDLIEKNGRMQYYYIFTIILVVLLIFLAFTYKRCPKDSILAVYSAYNQKTVITAISEGGTIVIPLYQGYATFPKGPIIFNINLSGNIKNDEVGVNLCLIYTVEIPLTKDILKNSIVNLAGLKTKQIIEKAKLIIETQVYKNLAKLSMQDLEDGEILISKLNFKKYSYVINGKFLRHYLIL